MNARFTQQATYYEEVITCAARIISTDGKNIGKYLPGQTAHLNLFTLSLVVYSISLTQLSGVDFSVI